MIFTVKCHFDKQKFTFGTHDFFSTNGFYMHFLFVTFLRPRFPVLPSQLLDRWRHSRGA